MTRKRRNTWALQDAKARFSEVVRKTKAEGAQIITVHGREEVAIVAIDEYRRLKGEGRTGADLIKAMQACPYDFDLEVDRDSVRGPVRDVDL